MLEKVPDDVGQHSVFRFCIFLFDVMKLLHLPFPSFSLFYFFPSYTVQAFFFLNYYVCSNLFFKLCVYACFDIFKDFLMVGTIVQFESAIQEAGTIFVLSFESPE